MAKPENKRVTGIKTSTLGLFQGSFFAIFGLGVAILHSLRATVDYAEDTESILSGMAFGLATGIISIIVLPLVYFAFGWVVGMLQGFVFNVVSETSGGITVRMEDDKS